MRRRLDIIIILLIILISLAIMMLATSCEVNSHGVHSNNYLRNHTVRCQTQDELSNHVVK